MMFLKILFIFLIFSICKVHLIDLGVKTADNYGPYKIDFTRYSQCHGPKVKDAASVDMVVNKINGSQIGTFNMTFFEQTRLDEVKVTVISIKEKQKIVLWSYRISKPCQHFLIASTIESKLHTKDCIAKKGSYIFELNYTEYSEKFYGASFFYGEYEIKSVVLSSKGNIMCLIMNPVFSKI